MLAPPTLKVCFNLVSPPTLKFPVSVEFVPTLSVVANVLAPFTLNVDDNVLAPPTLRVLTKVVELETLNVSLNAKLVPVVEVVSPHSKTLPLLGYFSTYPETLEFADGRIYFPPPIVIFPPTVKPSVLAKLA